ncbi:MAG: SDR family oxidoreductase [Bacteroidota bacterium]
MTIDLTGRIVLVTGASRGIGRALAQHLAQAGATVAVHGHRSMASATALARDLGRDARAFQADLADAQAVDGLFEAVLAAYGRLDVLVNNAGVAHEMPLAASTADWQANWDHTLAVNLRAPELLSRRLVQHLRVRGGAARAIHIASRAAFRGDTPDYMAYAASKAGLVALSRSLARGCGKDGLTSFVVAPGFVRTDMAQVFFDTYGLDYAMQGVALDRLTEPDDLGPVVVLLASGLADHATGTSIDVNAASYVR